jgi:uncharacterized protein YlaI
MTKYICGICGRKEDINNTKNWLISQRKNKPMGYLIIRCEKHITNYAKSIAGVI